MNGFYVQLHLHTSDTSRCGRASGRDMAIACKNAGYSLIAVTDHFFNANIGCDSELKWEEKVEYLFRGYYAAKRAGDEIGLTVLRGWETFQEGRELLTYGLDESFLLKNPDIDKIDYYEYIQRVTQAGGKIIHAHPYRRAPYIPLFKPDPTSVQAYEVYNASHKDPEYNRLALEEAREYGLIQFAGSDAHTTDAVGFGGMRLSEPAQSIHEIFAITAAGKARICEDMAKEKAKV